MRCAATTKENKRCSRLGFVEQNNLCTQHYRKNGSHKELPSDGPSGEIIWKVNVAVNKLGLMNCDWVQILLKSAPEFFLTMRDVQLIRKGTEAWVFKPYNYNRFEVLNASSPEQGWFYEWEGRAVTYSGADVWVVYRPGLLAKLINLYNDIYTDTENTSE